MGTRGVLNRKEDLELDWSDGNRGVLHREEDLELACRSQEEELGVGSLGWGNGEMGL